jgi:hypothetical protein
MFRWSLSWFRHETIFPGGSIETKLSRLDWRTSTALNTPWRWWNRNHWNRVGIEVALQPLDVFILQRVGANRDARKLASRD